MSRDDYPTSLTIADIFDRERRSINWARQSIHFTHESLLVAAQDIPDTPEFAEVRRVVFRAIDRLRQARGALTTAYDHTAEAKLVVERAEPISVTNRRLIERYGSNRSENGGTLVRKARRDRERREAEYGERERANRERERQAFLASRKTEQPE